MTTTLPPEFADLEPFAGLGAARSSTRYAKRYDSTMAELQAFYDAAFHRVEAALEYLDQFTLDALPDDAKNLLWLYCTLVTVSSLRSRRGVSPRVPDSDTSSIDAVLNTAV